MKKADRSKRNPPDRVLVLADAMPDSDPAFSIIAGILRIVPASLWTFARIEPGGELVSLFGSNVYGKGLPGLADELRLQRLNVVSGSRIAATLGELDDFASGVTLVFADARADYGILTLLRMPDLGPFTSSEISMLTFALDAASDRLSELRLLPPSRHVPMRAETDSVTDAVPLRNGAFYVLDADLQIVLAWTAESERHLALTGVQTRIADRLPIVLEDSVRGLTAGWADASGGGSRPGVSRPVPFLVLETRPLSGPAGHFIGVRIDRFRPSNSLTGAAARFHISPREVQVLALLLDGNHLDQIADRLAITSSTVQDHIKSMLDKTESINRSELIARVLGWESAPNAKRAV